MQQAPSDVEGAVNESHLIVQAGERRLNFSNHPAAS